jgi:Bacterial Ig-like domain (group 3)
MSVGQLNTTTTTAPSPHKEKLMSQHRSSHDASNHDSQVLASSSRFPRSKVMLAMAIVGGLSLTPLALDSSATADTEQAGQQSRVTIAPPVKPPTGMVWLQGTVTDQAGHGLDNVNVEVWSDDPAAAAPAGSNLSYGGFPADGRHGHGAFRVEVPLGQPYVIVFSGVQGAEDGDAFRMQSYGAGRPIMTLGGTAAAGAVRNLGSIELVHQGKVASKVKALKPAKVKAGKKGTLRLKVTSPFVAPVTGKVVVKVSGKKVTDKLTARDHGTATVRLPKLKSGTYKISAAYKGTGTVKPSDSKPVKLTVKK